MLDEQGENVIEALYYLYYSDRTGGPLVIEADVNDLFDYSPENFITRKAYSTHEEAQLALDHLNLIVQPSKMMMLVRWMRGNT